MIGPTLAEEIRLPVYRANGPFVAPCGDDLPFTVSWGINVHHRGFWISEVSFYHENLSCSSRRAFPDEAWYGSRVDLDEVSGDVVLENFLRMVMESRDDETAVVAEARVAQLWEVAESDRNWQALEVEIDGSPTMAKALSINGQTFVRARLPWGDLQIYPDDRRALSRLVVQRLTDEELQLALDHFNSRR